MVGNNVRVFRENIAVCGEHRVVLIGKRGVESVHVIRTVGKREYDGR